MTTTHYLKIDQRWLGRIRNNEKHAEVRLDDRDYQAGDRIEFSRENGSWTGVARTITHVLRTAPGLEDGYVVLSMQDSRLDRLAVVERENLRLERSNRRPSCCSATTPPPSTPRRHGPQEKVLLRYGRTDRSANGTT